MKKTAKLREKKAKAFAETVGTRKDSRHNGPDRPLSGTFPLIAGWDF